MQHATTSINSCNKETKNIYLITKLLLWQTKASYKNKQCDFQSLIVPLHLYWMFGILFFLWIFHCIICSFNVCECMNLNQWILRVCFTLLCCLSCLLISFYFNGSENLFWCNIHVWWIEVTFIDQFVFSPYSVYALHYTLLILYALQYSHFCFHFSMWLREHCVFCIMFSCMTHFSLLIPDALREKVTWASDMHLLAWYQVLEVHNWILKVASEWH